MSEPCLNRWFAFEIPRTLLIESAPLGCALYVTWLVGFFFCKRNDVLLLLPSCLFVRSPLRSIPPTTATKVGFAPILQGRLEDWWLSFGHSTTPQVDVQWYMEAVSEQHLLPAPFDV